MPRKRLTDEERDMRRRERNRKVLNSYARHTGERGSPEKWRQLAEHLRTKVGDVVEACKCLGLTSVPTPDDLRRAYRTAMMTAHPDRGGSEEAAKEVIKSYRTIKKYLTKETA